MNDAATVTGDILYIDGGAHFARSEWSSSHSFVGFFQTVPGVAMLPQ